MQFITNGPDIPDSLLRAHEEGRVVFFCGAGISYPAGLPGFCKLVDDIYDVLGTQKNEIETESYKKGHYDSVLGLLERRLPGGSFELRSALAKVLKPDFKKNGATKTHESILILSRNHDGRTRLVTTNFDRVFKYSAKKINQKISKYSAPMLPTPKNSRWNGIVYLHGLLPKKNNKDALQKLVITSGDFGAAYLVERWASRFVSELFRNYVVCFVGYSIDDPVLRYMMDALAADRLQGEVTPEAFAFADFEPEQRSEKLTEWKAKGVTPILYEAPSSKDHSALHNTLKSWADTYRDGVNGRERIVTAHALAHPSASTKQDDFVGRMLWALSHESGVPARRFSEFNPLPPIEWLDVFLEKKYKRADLIKFGITPQNEDENFSFSFIDRPTPHTHSTNMSLFPTQRKNIEWDKVMYQIARWLSRHIDNPKLIIKLAQVEELSESWKRLIENQLDEIKTNKINSNLDHQTKGILKLLINGRVKPAAEDHDFYSWIRRFERNGLSSYLRLELRELLSVKISLQKPYDWPDNMIENQNKINWQLSLSTSHAHHALKDINNTKWNNALKHLHFDFQLLLHDAMELLQELGAANEQEDRSFYDMPSISDHFQNNKHKNWVVLIELLRDSWISIFNDKPEHATKIALEWFELPYPVFQRLALFAASKDPNINAAQWVQWLTKNNSYWLWSICTRREVIRLFVEQGKSLSKNDLIKLEQAILIGPIRSMYKKDLTKYEWEKLVNKETWIYLSKLSDEGGVTLSNNISHHLSEISKANPEWVLKPYERDEFTRWSSRTGFPDFEENRTIDTVPRKRSDIYQWLKTSTPRNHPFHEDTWRETCQSRFFHSFFALKDLSDENIWPAERWRSAIQVWSDEKYIARSWKYCGVFIMKMPDTIFEKNINNLSWWLLSASEKTHNNKLLMISLCSRIMKFSYNASIISDEPINHALNHPVGQATQALINLCFKPEPNDNDTLNNNLREIFSMLCSVGSQQFQPARVILASRLIPLFRIDPEWTKKYLLPLFNWKKHPVEARLAWEGFLWSPRLHPELMILLKPFFLDTTNHYDLLSETRQFSTFLTYAALGPQDGYSATEFRMAIDILPQKALNEIANALVQELEGSGDKLEDYWRNRIKPFLDIIWPKIKNNQSEIVSKSFIRLAIAAKDEFPSAIETLNSWITPVKHPGYLLSLLIKSEIPKNHPSDCLNLLGKFINKNSLPTTELRLCLNNILSSDKSLKLTSNFRKLDEYLKNNYI